MQGWWDGSQGRFATGNRATRGATTV